MQLIGIEFKKPTTLASLKVLGIVAIVWAVVVGLYHLLGLENPTQTALPLLIGLIYGGVSNLIGIDFTKGGKHFAVFIAGAVFFATIAFLVY